MLNNKVFMVGIIGLGHQSLNDHIPSLLKRTDVEIVAVCDTSVKKRDDFSLKYPKIANKAQLYKSHSSLLKKEKIDFAVVAVPHDQYFEIVKDLCQRHIPFIKEKPFARNKEEMKKLLSISDIEKYCFICSQRRYSPLYQKVYKEVGKIGKTYLFNVIYKLNIPDPSEGWRGDIVKSGGGCILDMGYHVIDQLLWWFGEPDKLFVSKSSLAVPTTKKYAEDTSIISFSYKNGLQGSIVLSRSAGEKKEEYALVGSKAQITGNKIQILIKDKSNKILLQLNEKDDTKATENQLNFFIDRIKENKGFSDILLEHKKDMEFINRCYNASSD